MKVDSIYLYKDERYLINMTKNHWQSMTIQVARFGPKHIVDAKGRMAVEQSFFVAWEKNIFTLSDPNFKAKIDPVKPLEFKKQVQAAIAEAQTVLGKLQELDHMMDGVINDYYSQSRKYNQLPESPEEVAQMNELQNGKRPS